MNCPYCRETIEGKRYRTKEHIIPNGLISLYPEQDITFLNDKSFIDNNGLTINDVCNICNNGTLSDLDGYGNGLIRNNFLCSFGIHNNYNNEFDIKLNYHLLSRWLLKIAFNTERLSKGDISWFNNNLDYIIQGEQFYKANFSLFGGLHINMVPVLEEMEGVLPLQIAKDSKLIPLGFKYYRDHRKLQMEYVNSELAEHTYVMRFASAVFLLVLWKDEFEEEKINYDNKIRDLFTFEKLSSEQEDYKLRRVSDALNSKLGYGFINGLQGLIYSEEVIKNSIGGRNFWETRASFAKSFTPEFLQEGRRLVEAVSMPHLNRAARRKAKKKKGK